MAGTLVEALICGDRTRASLADRLDAELRPTKRTATVRVRVRSATVVEPANGPHVYFETSADGSEREELADVGDVRPGFVREANQTFPTGVAVRLRWQQASGRGRDGLWWLKVWLGHPAARYG